MVAAGVPLLVAAGSVPLPAALPLIACAGFESLCEGIVAAAGSAGVSLPQPKGLITVANTSDAR
jgi:hypothetical protein